jgi:hypothetical protein
MLGPAGTVHVFEKEPDAKAYTADSLGARQVGTEVVQSSNPRAVEIVRGCV